MSSLTPESEIELRRLGKKIGKNVGRALIERDEASKAEAHIHKMINDLNILEHARTTINPFNEDARLVWSDGHTLEETINELRVQIKKIKTRGLTKLLM
jgi:DNA invertase Pin-like site-specific DNA recombinase